MRDGVNSLPVGQKLGLGVGLDMPWGTRIGFHMSREGDDISSSVRSFFRQNGGDFSYAFLAFQPRDFGPLRAERYFAAYDRFFAEVPAGNGRVFHHTLLNTGSPEGYEKEQIAQFTNELIDRYGFSWIVEDLGIWSFRGKTLPYPLPPLLTDEGALACIAHIREWRSLLQTPLSVEFPGFTEGGSFVLGSGNAFDFFRRVVEESAALATIDIGHILSYQWFRGFTGDRVYEELERLPLDRCVEFHLSGCQIVNGKFRDLHHGVLLDEQIDLLDHLIPRCPNLTGVTYEDPLYNADGMLVPKSVANYHRLRERVRRWASDGG
jgi:uncharacterized protein